MSRPAFSRLEVAAVVITAAVAGCVPALQPILLGGLLSEGRIDAVAMGYAATAEGLGMAVATALAGALLPPRRLRTIGAAALVAVLVANGLTTILPAAGVITARGLAGLGNGVLLWLLVGMLARSAAPTRLYAVYITANASLVFLLSMFLTTFAIARYGVVSGYVALFAIYAVLLLIIQFAPHRYADLAGDSNLTIPPPQGLVALGAVVLFLAGVMAFWVYCIPLGNQMGLSTQSVQTMIGAATGIQIIAGLTAIAVATRLTGMQAMVGTTVVMVAALTATMVDGVWLPALLAFSFCWMFGPPFHMAFLITADPSRRSAMFVGTAQLGGLAVGPLLASSMISSADYGPARLVSLACFAAVMVIAAAIHLRTRVVTSRRAPVLSP